MCTFRTHLDCLLSAFSWCCGQVQSPVDVYKRLKGHCGVTEQYPSPLPPHPPTKSQKWTNNGFRSTNSLRKHPFLLALRRWDVPSDEERGETYVFAGYSTKKHSFLPYNWLVSFLGVLFSKATHYLPLNFTREDKTKLVDMRGNATGMVFNTINASTAEQIGHVLRLNGIDNYIELNNLKDECITNPSKCTEGLSVAFWIKYTEGK